MKLKLRTSYLKNHPDLSDTVKNEYRQIIKEKSIKNFRDDYLKLLFIVGSWHNLNEWSSDEYWNAVKTNSLEDEVDIIYDDPEFIATIESPKADYTPVESVIDFASISRISDEKQRTMINGLAKVIEQNEELRQLFYQLGMANPWQFFDMKDDVVVFCGYVKSQDRNTPVILTFSLKLDKINLYSSEMPEYKKFQEGKFAEIYAPMEKYCLAQDYEMGRNGHLVDLNMARCLYEQAAEMGFQPAKEVCGKLANANSGSGSVAGAVASTVRMVEVAGIAQRLEDGLVNLNVMRGGTKGFKGFVAEELQAAEASIQGKITYVINDNGAADLVYIGNNGHRYYQQLKTGYTPGQINYEAYRGQTLIIDKGNPRFAEFEKMGREYGVRVVEGSISKEEAQQLADWMRAETGITGASTATITPKIFAIHKAGVQAAKTGALVGGAFSAGANLVEVISGDKKASDAAADVVVDTAVSGTLGYGLGAAGKVIAGTKLGAEGIALVHGAVSAVEGTAIGGTIIGAGAAASTAVAGATAATLAAIGSGAAAVGSVVGTAAVGATTAVAGAAAGAAVASGVAAVGAGAAAAGAAVAAGAVAAAPVVAAGALAVGACKLIKKFF